MLGDVAEDAGEFGWREAAFEGFGALGPWVEAEGERGAVGGGEQAVFGEQAADGVHAQAAAADDAALAAHAAADGVGGGALLVGFGGVEHPCSGGGDAAGVGFDVEDSPADGGNSEVDPNDAHAVNSFPRQS